MGPQLVIKSEMKIKRINKLLRIINKYYYKFIVNRFFLRNSRRETTIFQLALNIFILPLKICSNFFKFATLSGSDYCIAIYFNF